MELEVNLPLVSVIVISYNSSAYIEETLESIKEQTYGNLELIISDDASTDETINICKKWLATNKTLFSKSNLLIASVNKGIPANCNRGLNQANGTWVKLIAGDDKLFPTAIKDYVEYVQGKDFSFVFARPKIETEWKDFSFDKQQEERLQKGDHFFELNAEQQFLHLLIKPYPINPPTIFIKRETLLELNGFNEQYLNEDFPLYLKATYSGYKLFLLRKKTLIYRVHKQSFSRKVMNNDAVSFFRKLKMRKIIREYISWKLFLKHPFVVWDYYNQFIIDEIVILLENKKTWANNLKILRIFSPLYVSDFIKRRLL